MCLFIPYRTQREQPIYKNTRAEWYSLHKTRQINNYVLWNYVAAKLNATRYINLKTGVTRKLQKLTKIQTAKIAKINKIQNREKCNDPAKIRNTIRRVAQEILYISDIPKVRPHKTSKTEVVSKLTLISGDRKINTTENRTKSEK